MPELSYMALAPFCVLYLIIDRCLALRLINNQTNKLLFYLAVLIASLIYSSSLGIYIAELPLNLNKGTVTFEFILIFESNFKEILVSFYRNFGLKLVC